MCDHKPTFFNDRLAAIKCNKIWTSISRQYLSMCACPVGWQQINEHQLSGHTTVTSGQSLIKNRKEKCIINQTWTICPYSISVYGENGMKIESKCISILWPAQNPDFYHSHTTLDKLLIFPVAILIDRDIHSNWMWVVTDSIVPVQHSLASL